MASISTCLFKLLTLTSIWLLLHLIDPMHPWPRCCSNPWSRPCNTISWPLFVCVFFWSRPDHKLILDHALLASWSWPCSLSLDPYLSGTAQDLDLIMSSRRQCCPYILPWDHTGPWHPQNGSKTIAGKPCIGNRYSICQGKLAPKDWQHVEWQRVTGNMWLATKDWQQGDWQHLTGNKRLVTRDWQQMILLFLLPTWTILLQCTMYMFNETTPSFCFQVIYILWGRISFVFLGLTFWEWPIFERCDPQLSASTFKKFYCYRTNIFKGVSLSI